VYKSVAVLKRQCANKKKKKKVKRKRRRRFGSAGEEVMNIANTGGHYPLQSKILGYMGSMNMNRAIQRFKRARNFIWRKMAIPGGIRKNLERADLRGAILQYARLQGADLRDARLHGADLFNAYLQDADLRGADLQRADLAHANLRGADLNHADLHSTSLREADLQGADLQGAFLVRANLEEADLQGADLRRADLREAYTEGALYSDDTRFPLLFQPQNVGMVRVNNFGKKRKKTKK
tara:strand:- start:38 stop:748 length:711 start_codon:yes stop_codon:yes gene_type:complete